MLKTYKQIERSREVRLWVSMIGSGVIAVFGMMSPEEKTKITQAIQDIMLNLRQKSKKIISLPTYKKENHHV